MRETAPMDEPQARERFAAARVARLATVDPAGRPHLVPVTFAVDGDRIVTVVDHKPKRTRSLRRLANIEANPRVSLLVDEYDEDWTRLWWVRADGIARISTGGPGYDRALAALVRRYEQYRRHVPEGPLISVDVERWTGWSWLGAGASGA